MPELKQTGYDEIMPNGGGIAAPGEPHMACVLLLDTSGSMYGDPIDSLNRAVNDFKEQTSMDELAQKRVDIAIVQFGSTASVVQDFTPLPQMAPVSLSASGSTSMGAGIQLAIDLVKERNRFYNDMGTPCFKPWIFMITDGAPTDDISAARQRIIEEENKGSHGKLKFWAVGVPGYDESTLTSLTKRCIALNEANFKGINVKGESLSQVIIFKLPFPVPDPIVEYKMRKTECPLMDVAVPEMIIKLKQGVGRLIRSSDDKGMVSILDPRVSKSLNTAYREDTLASLPEKNITEDITELEEFWNRIKEDGNHE